MDIEKNLAEIKKDIGKARLIAVTKTVDVSVVKELKALGVNCFGESRVKDAERKIRKIDSEWHMIGHLQTNKVKLAVELFNMIQSVDSVELAKKIDSESKKQNKIMPILLQVNIANEPQKYGFGKEEIDLALKEISRLKNIKAEGFMMMAPLVEPEKTRQYFKDMKTLFDKYQLEYLSMGMTNDYKVAVEEGSNMIRIGRKLFV